MDNNQLNAQFINQSLKISGRNFGLQLNLAEALLTQVLLNKALNKPETTNQQLVTDFCKNLLTSLSFLPSRFSQLAINELELKAQACLLKRLESELELELLLEKISNRRLSQAKEEASYLNKNLDIETEIRLFLLPAFYQLDNFLAANQLSWPDPEGVYF